MGNDQTGPILHDLLQCILDQKLCFGIHAGGGLIQDQDLGFKHQHSGQSQQLALTRRKVAAPFPHPRPELPRQPANETFRIGVASSSLHTF